MPSSSSVSSRPRKPKARVPKLSAPRPLPAGDCKSETQVATIDTTTSATATVTTLRVLSISAVRGHQANVFVSFAAGAEVRGEAWLVPVPFQVDGRHETREPLINRRFPKAVEMF